MDTSVWRVLPDDGPLVAPAGSVTSVAVLAGLPALLRRAADLGGATTLRPAPGPRGTRR